MCVLVCAKEVAKEDAKKDAKGIEKMEKVRTKMMQEGKSEQLILPQANTHFLPLLSI